MSSSAQILIFLPRWHQSAAVMAQATDINGGNERRRDRGVTFLWSWLCFDYIWGVNHVAWEWHDWWGRLIFSLSRSCFTLVSFLTASTPSSTTPSFSLRPFCPSLTHSILGRLSCPLQSPEAEGRQWGLGGYNAGLPRKKESIWTRSMFKLLKFYI